MTLLWSSWVAIIVTLILLKAGKILSKPIARIVGHLKKIPSDKVYPTVLTTYHFAILVGITGIIIASKAFKWLP